MSEAESATTSGESAHSDALTPSKAYSTQARGLPYLPSHREALLLGFFPAIVVFGTLFGVLSPSGRAGGLGGGPVAWGQPPPPPPNYFARKDNVLNVFFVKRGWFWISLAFGLFAGTRLGAGSDGTHTSNSSPTAHTILGRRASAFLRWGLVTGWWILVTQWCFGPPLIDRSFRLTGGGCEAWPVGPGIPPPPGMSSSPASVVPLAALLASAACRRSGGRWSGGHDISGHVFLLVLGTTFLAQEVGWVLWRARFPRADDRTVTLADGSVQAVQAADGEAIPGSVETAAVSWWAVRFVGGVVVLGLWMLLMTAMYFHTWREKLSGLLVALAGLYGVYVVPRFVPAVRRVVGLPGL